MDASWFMYLFLYWGLLWLFPVSHFYSQCCSNYFHILLSEFFCSVFLIFKDVFDVACFVKALLSLWQYCFCFTFWFFLATGHVESYIPGQASNLYPLRWYTVATAALPGKPLYVVLQMLCL